MIGGGKMREAVQMYIWYFFSNSVAYALVISLDKALKYQNGLTDNLVALIVVTMLSIVSLLVDRIGTAIIAHAKMLFGFRLAVFLFLVFVVSMFVDVCILQLMTNIVDGLSTNSLDRIVLSGLCQIMPIESLREIQDD